MSIRTRAACLGLVLCCVSCGGEGGPLSRWTPTRSPHEAYAESLREAGLASHAIGEAWLAASISALASATPVSLPFRESGYLDPAEPTAVAFRFDLPRGRALDVELTFETNRAARLFVDLYRVTEAAPARVAGADDGALSLRYVSRRDGEYILRLQPELLGGGRYTIVQRAEASLRFPVDGATERNIQSVFGDARDGGQRDHHGVDIFSPRGTPVVAAADGVIRSVSTTNIGGRVVWLSDASIGQSLYYAHLDDWNVRAGQHVKAGDVIGYVGNTGNARSTPPHLHFGIYSGGPVDPLPFIRASDRTPAAPTGAAALLGEWARIARRATPLRPGPDRAAAPLGQLDASTAVQVSAASGVFYRVALPDGRRGYVEARALAAIDPATRPRRLDRAAPLLDRPVDTAIVIQPLAAGTQVAVLAEFNGFSLVDASGRRGWIR